uniref:Uncharacterized protein n=1 Tax=Anguilla anguilla TaxID=7936 RepID=A0A0E9V158_ANGAN
MTRELAHLRRAGKESRCLTSSTSKRPAVPVQSRARLINQNSN